jgi:hypothetical protein
MPLTIGDAEYYTTREALAILGLAPVTLRQLATDQPARPRWHRAARPAIIGTMRLPDGRDSYYLAQDVDAYAATPRTTGRKAAQ